MVSYKSTNFEQKQKILTQQSWCNTMEQSPNALGPNLEDTYYITSIKFTGNLHLYFENKVGAITV